MISEEKGPEAAATAPDLASTTTRSGMNTKANNTMNSETPVDDSDMQQALYVAERLSSILNCTAEHVFDPAIRRSVSDARRYNWFEVSENSAEDLQYLIVEVCTAIDVIQRKFYAGRDSQLQAGSYDHAGRTA